MKYKKIDYDINMYGKVDGGGTYFFRALVKSIKPQGIVRPKVNQKIWGKFQQYSHRWEQILRRRKKIHTLSL